jgi:gas vesicle protein
MGEDPREIRQEIEQTRERMGDTVEALSYKADVKTRAKESVTGKVDSVKDKLSDTASSVQEKIAGTGATVSDRVGGAASAVGERTPSGEEVKQGAKQAVGVAQENPLGLAIGSVAVGFLAGMLIPSTRIEDDKVGPLADQLKEQVCDTGQEALERGKQVAQRAADSAKQTAQESGQQQAQELGTSVEERAEDTRGSL